MIKTNKNGLQPWLSSIIAVVLFITDRILKYKALHQQPITSNQQPFLSFQLFKNTGLIASIPVPSYIYWIITIFGLALLAVIITLIIRKKIATHAGIIALIFLGALSNSIDRVAYRATIDYLIFFGRSAVNIADGMIVVGVLLLLRDANKKTEDVT